MLFGVGECFWSCGIEFFSIVLVGFVVNQNKEVPFSATANLGPRIDPMITHIRSGSGGRGFGLPPASKFRSGHLPSNAIPVSRAIPGDGDESGSASDNDRTTDSEDGVYGGRYSLDSSPQDERVPSAASAHRYGKPSNGQPRCSSDYMYSDVSSSMDTVVGRHKPVAERLARGSERYPVGQNGYAEDESSDSAGSSTSQAGGGSINSAVPHGRAYASEGYNSSVQSKRNLGSTAEKVCTALIVLALLFDIKSGLSPSLGIQILVSY